MIRQDALSGRRSLPLGQTNRDLQEAGAEDLPLRDRAVCFGGGSLGPTLAGTLIARAEQAGHETAYTFLKWKDAADPEIQRISYGELLATARSVGARLADCGARGDRVLVLCPPGAHYVAAFFGCVLAGMVAVPAYPPRSLRRLERLDAIADDAEASMVLAPPDLADRLEQWASRRPRQPRLVAIDQKPTAPPGEWTAPAVMPEDVAFLQYTSGSTGAPKGVVVRHREAIANIRAIIGLFELDPTSCGAFWLPPYHDMGLIGALLTPLCAGFESVLMSPEAFVQRPARWLRALSDHAATITTAPDFGWRLCVDEVEDTEIDGLDLSRLRHALSGAEPVRFSTLRDFAQRYAPAGFRLERFRPVYGMAETVLIASGAVCDVPPSARRIVHGRVADKLDFTEAPPPSSAVSCGVTLPEHEIVIVNEATRRPASSGSVGEIWLSGPSLTGGYWRQPQATAEAFDARLDDAPGDRAYLRTGDLGALVNGELYVLGRIKETIVIRGRNHYCHDLEATAATADAALAPERTVAFALDDPEGERVSLVMELRRNAIRTLDVDALAGRVRRAILENHGLDVAAAVFVKPASLPRTTSGKPRRRHIRDLFRDGGLAEVGAWRRDGPPACPEDRPAKGDALPDAHAVADALLRRDDIASVAARWAVTPEGVARLSIDATPSPSGASRPAPSIGGRATDQDRMRLGLFFFGSDEETPAGRGRAVYQLLLEAAERADRAGLAAVWTPERHFSVFGGQYPNPVATSAAIAARTSSIAVRAGSVVVPLHHPARIAEDWAVIDNLSGGRAGLSIASGWHARDFVLAPGAHAQRKRLTYEAVEFLRRLWRGEEISFSNGAEAFPIRIRPLPVQDEIPLWLTAAGSEETFAEAGRKGLNLLTFFAQSSPEQVASRIALYREAFRPTGAAVSPHATVMAHTLVAATQEAARASVREPLRRYLSQATDLAVTSGLPPDGGGERVARARNALVERAAERFTETRSLIGDMRQCLDRIATWRAHGIDEIACLVDFGLPEDQVLHHLDYLFELNDILRRTQRSESRGQPSETVLANMLQKEFPALRGRLEIRISKSPGIGPSAEPASDDPARAEDHAGGRSRSGMKSPLERSDAVARRAALDDGDGGARIDRGGSFADRGRGHLSGQDAEPEPSSDVPSRSGITASKVAFSSGSAGEGLSRLVCERLAATLGRAAEDVHPGLALDEIGLNSLHATRLVMDLSDATGRELDLSSVFGSRTVAELVVAVETAAGAGPRDAPQTSATTRRSLETLPGPQLLRFPHAGPQSVSSGAAASDRLYCIHPALGLAGCYRRLAGPLRGLAEVVGLEAPRADSGHSFESYDEMIEAYAAAVAEDARDRPVLLLGWSFGGHLAADMAVSLETAESHIRGVVIFDAVEAEPPRQGGPVGLEPLAAWIVEMARLRYPGRAFEIARQPDLDGRLDLFAKAAVECGEVDPEDVPRDPRRLERLLRLAQRNAALLKGRPRRRRSSAAVLVVRAADTAARIPDRALGWRACFSRTDARDAPYPHASLLTADAAALLGGWTAAWLQDGPRV